MVLLIPMALSTRIETRLRECTKASRRRVGPIKAAGVIFGTPGVFQARIVEHHRGIIDERGRGHSLFKGRGINKGLEAGARLTGGLRGAIELALEEIESAHDGYDGAVIRPQSHQGSLYPGNLRQSPLAVGLVLARG